MNMPVRRQVLIKGFLLFTFFRSSGLVLAFGMLTEIGRD